MIDLSKRHCLYRHLALNSVLLWQRAPSIITCFVNSILKRRQWLPFWDIWWPLSEPFVCCYGWGYYYQFLHPKYRRRTARASWADWLRSLFSRYPRTRSLVTSWHIVGIGTRLRWVHVFATTTIGTRGPIHQHWEHIERLTGCTLHLLQYGGCS